MTKYCPICRSKYSDERELCSLDGMRLFSKGDDMLGSVLMERYKVEKKIGSGGMAVVYKSSDLVGGETRAIKLLRRELSFEAKQRIRFMREAKAAGLILHENVVKIFDVGESEQGQAFMVMEYLEGPTVGQLIERGIIPIHKALWIVKEAARGLQKAHECGVIHRDVKPENLILSDTSKNGQKVKVLDFGLARVKGDLGLTATGQVFGTPEYLSPEQATGCAATPASDQYGLGILFYEMLTGKLPFSGPPATVLLHHFKRIPSPPSELCPELGICEELDLVVGKMLSKKPTERFSDLNAFCFAIDPLFDLYTPK